MKFVEIQCLWLIVLPVSKSLCYSRIFPGSIMILVCCRSCSAVATELTRDFHGVRVAQSLVFYVVFCRTLLIFMVFFLLAIVSSVIRFTASDYPLDMFKLFLHIQRYDHKWFVIFHKITTFTLETSERYTSSKHNKIHFVH